MTNSFSSLHWLEVRFTPALDFLADVGVVAAHSQIQSHG
jgi:hypothetical protein